jgi:hypothetical protein
MEGVSMACRTVLLENVKTQLFVEKSEIRVRRRHTTTTTTTIQKEIVTRCTKLALHKVNTIQFATFKFLF